MTWKKIENSKYWKVKEFFGIDEMLRIRTVYVKGVCHKILSPQAHTHSHSILSETGWRIMIRQEKHIRKGVTKNIKICKNCFLKGGFYKNVRPF